jgi:poly(3-hydroxybutyrate) depolymerase
MQGGGVASAATARSGAQRRIVPAIVFHGDRDRTVNPRNADAVIAQSAQAEALSKHIEQGQAAGGHAYSRTLSTDAAGRIIMEQWVVHGAGHAWFGGSMAGFYTDPRGPDATREMLRFFLEHPHPTAVQAD